MSLFYTGVDTYRPDMAEHEDEAPAVDHENEAPTPK